jgi:hypothetical protein
MDSRDQASVLFEKGRVVGERSSMLAGWYPRSRAKRVVQRIRCFFAGASGGLGAKSASRLESPRIGAFTFFVKKIEGMACGRRIAKVEVSPE